jgi:hypothetical protein
MAIGTPVLLGTASSSTGVTTLVVTTGADAPVGTLLTVFVLEAGASAITIADSAGNTWTAGYDLAAATPTFKQVKEFWSVLANDLPLGGTITVTFASSHSGIVVAIATSGIGASPSNIQGAGVNSTTTTPSISTGTLATANQIIFGVVGVNSGAGRTFTEPGAFTQIANVATGDLLHVAYAIVSSTGSVTYNPVPSASVSCWINVSSFEAAAGATNYTLTAAEGSFALNGAVTPNAVLSAGRVVSAAQGAFALTGEAASFPRTRVFAAGQGAFALTGEAAAVGHGRTLSAAQGGFTLTGEAASFPRSRVFAAGQGAFALTGEGAILNSGRTLSAAHRSFLLAGEDASFPLTLAFTADQGVFALTGGSGGGGGGGYTTGAVALDGATFLETASLTATDSSEIIATGWVLISSNAIPNSPVTILWDINPVGFEAGFFLSTAGAFQGYLQNADGSSFFSWSTAAGVWPFDANWHSLVFSASLNFAAGSKRIALYLDDVQVAITGVEDTGAAFTQILSGQDIGVPDATTDYPVLYSQYAADYQFYSGAAIVQADGTIDVSDRRNFVAADNTPVDPALAIAAYGSPLWQFIRAPSAAASTFATNLGTGGDFTITGTLTDAPSSPSPSGPSPSTDLSVGRNLGAGQGSFLLTGDAATLGYGRTLSAADGSFSLSGESAGLGYGRTLIAADGTFTLSGEAVGFPVAKVFPAALGLYALNGESAGLSAGRHLGAGAGLFALTGELATFASGKGVAAATGVFALAGGAAIGTAARTFPVAGASFVLNGRDVALGRRLVFAAGDGAVALTGEVAGFLVGRQMGAAPGLFSFTGEPAILRASGGALPHPLALTGRVSSATAVGRSGALILVGRVSEGRS